MNIKWILFILLAIPTISDACTKEIKVLVYYEKSLPSLIDMSKKKYVEGEKKIKINCDLYDTVSVGDILHDPSADPEVSVRGSLFNGAVEEKKYKVLSK